jgi:hypothetical protein
VVDLIQKTVWRLAVAFNRHPFHELACDSDWGRISHLVDRGIVAWAIHWSFSDRVASVRHSRELGKEESKTELPAKQQKVSGRIAMMKRILSLLGDPGTEFCDNRCGLNRSKQHYLV